MVNFLRLIRWKNILLICIGQLLIAYYAHGKSFDAISLSSSIFILITGLIAAAGNLINDFFDYDIDLINKKDQLIIGNKISKKSALFGYGLLNVCTLFLIIYEYWLTQLTTLAIVGLVMIVLLFLYTKYLKPIALLGNGIIAFFTAFAIGAFAYLPITLTQTQVFWIFSLAVFCFLTNLAREIIKDVTDQHGDYLHGLKTLPIVLGKKRTIQCVIFIMTLTFLFSIWVVSTITILFVKFYFLLTISTPILYIYTQLQKAKKQKHYQYISNLLKILMAFGISTILII